MVKIAIILIVRYVHYIGMAMGERARFTSCPEKRTIRFSNKGIRRPATRHLPSSVLWPQKCRLSFLQKFFYLLDGLEPFGQSDQSFPYFVDCLLAHGSEGEESKSSGWTSSTYAIPLQFSGPYKAACSVLPR